MDDVSASRQECLDLLGVGIAAFDEGRKLVHCNSAFRSLRQYPDQLCSPGVSLEALLRFNAERGDFGPGDPAAQVAERLAEIMAADAREIEREMADGQVLRIRYRRMPSGGTMLTFEDRTAERQAQAALAASEERYALVSDAAEEAIYEWHISRGRFYASPRLAELIGREWGEAGERPWDWEELVHPDDLARYRANLAAHLSGAEQRWRCEYRLKDASGAWRWVSDHGTSIRDRDGKATRMVAAIRDVTERVAKDAALAASEQRHTLVTQATSDGIYDWNVTDDLLYVSDKLIRILDFDFGIKASGMWAARVHPDDLERYVAAIRAHFKGETDALECEYRVRGSHGDYRWIQDRGIGVRGEDGRVTRMVGAVRDITEMKAAQAELDRTEELLMSSLATISDGILLVDGENRVQLWNDRYYEIFSEAAGGADLTGIIVKGRRFEDMIRDGYNMGAFKPDPDGVDAWVASRMKAWSEPAARWEFELANGSWILLNERQIPDGGRVSVYTDITELKRREQEAQAARQRFEDAIESISSGFALFDAEDKLVVWNARFQNYFAEMADVFTPGRTFREILAATIDRGLFPAATGDPGGFLNALMEKRAEGVGQVRENLLSNGMWLQITDHRTKDGGLVSIYTDVTGLKTSEQQALAARQRFEEAIEAISSGFSLWDADDRLVTCNSRYRELYADLADAVRPGIAVRELLMIAATRGLLPAAKGDPEGYVEENLRKRKAGLGQLREHRLANGTWLQITDHRTADGGIVSVHTDVTELKTREEELGRQTAILEETLENMGQGITMVDQNLRTLAFNRKFFELMEFPPDRFGKGFTMEDAFRFNAERGEYGPGDVKEQVRERIELAKKFLPHRFERTRPDGTVLEIVGNPMEGGGLVATYTDITERKRAEEALKAALDEFDTVIENIAYGVLFTGPDGRARICNRAFREMWGVPQALIDQHPTMREMIEFNRDTGLYGIAAEEWDVWLDDRLAQIAAGDIAPVEFHRADGMVLTYQCVALPDGGRMLTYFDITELKQREAEIARARDEAQAALADLQKAQERLIQAEKMASLGQLTAGIAHEIKNPLNFVNNFAKLSDEMLEELTEILEAPIQALDAETRDDAEDLLATVRENLCKINQHGRRADSIVKNMLLHSREGPSQQQTVGLNAIAEEALNLAYHGARAEHPGFNIALKKALDPQVGEIECFPQEVMRVFLNLISNGMYAANKRLTESGGAPPEIALTTRANGAEVEVEIRDNGTGIPPELREKIFNPFFTTKPAGEGTGLGLSLSYDIVVKQHGGELALESEPGRFTSFRVTLPRTLPASGGSRR